MQGAHLAKAMIETNPGQMYALGMGSLLICPECGEYVAGLSNPLPFEASPMEWANALVNMNLDLGIGLQFGSIDDNLGSFAYCMRCGADLYPHLILPLNWETECVLMVPIVAIPTLG